MTSTAGFTKGPSQAEVKRKVKALGKISDAQKREIVCALIGHSRICETCFGYWHCGRCNAMLGDSLAGAFNGKDKVIIGHDCETCRKNYEGMTWHDKFMCADPFAKAVSP